MNIALSIRVKLLREFSQKEWMKLEIRVKPGRHDKASEIDKQVADKERVAAAMENDAVMGVIEGLIKQKVMH